MADNKEDDTIKKLNLSTDRCIYNVSGTLNFQVSYIQDSRLSTIAQSKVLMLDLLAPNGTILYKGKFPIDSLGATGAFTIPSGILTGSYYLRAYTRTMKNMNPAYFSYQLIQIINPYEIQTLQPETQQVLDSIPYFFPDSLCKIHLAKEHFKQNEMIQVELQDFNPQLQPHTLSVSVIPEQSYFNSQAPPIISNEDVKHTTFHTEADGILLEGLVRDSATQKPLVYASVQLTIFNEAHKLYSTYSDTSGHFAFNIKDLEGNLDLFISATGKRNELPEVMISNDFCTEKVKLPYIPFNPYLINSKANNQIATSQQLESIYAQKDKPEKSDSNAYYFYGKPNLAIDIKTFIALPTIQDYVTDLMYNVRVVKHKGVPYFECMGPPSELRIFAPLVMIDLVAFTDAATVLALNPKKLKRIEIINQPYLIGDQTFGGIIHFITQNNDMGGTELPKSGKFFNYQFFEPNAQNIDTLRAASSPYLANTLYWNPAIQIHNNNSVLEFKTNDRKGNYSIIVNGYTKDGTRLQSKKSLIID